MNQIRRFGGSIVRNIKSIRLSIATKLILSFLLIIIMTGAIFTTVGITLISDHIKADAQEQVEADLDKAREIYLNRQSNINNIVKSTANSFPVRVGILSSDMEQAATELVGIKVRDALSILTITDGEGKVLFRAGNPDIVGDSTVYNELVNSVISDGLPTSGTMLLAAEDVAKESPFFMENVATSFADLPATRYGSADNDQDAMVLAAAAPILAGKDELLGVVYGGVLLNNNRDFICAIKNTLYQNKQYDNKDLGFTAIYQDELEILTCPLKGEVTESPEAENILGQVYEAGNRWIGRNIVHDDWYVTIYEPIKNTSSETIGMLQVGQLEQRYLDIRNQIVIAFVSITLIGALVAIFFAYFIAQRISGPLKKLVAASSKVAHGDLDARVDINSMSNDELGELADAFNSMALALKQRDEQLKELTRSRVSRSERLALIGKLSANVAHELNNPLQGIVTYSHLLLERMPAENHDVKYVKVIVAQANRSREIIRGLLDFARQREPDKYINDVNLILHEAISLLEHQALYHNIEIIKEFDAHLPMTIVDPSQIERVFVNMIVNAAEAMDGIGTLTLETDFVPIEESIEMRVSDTGCGISNENLRRIFDPFFTTKEVGRGTGLGLAISYGIIQEHGGKILVESELGKGTTFTIILPVTTESEIQAVYG